MKRVTPFWIVFLVIEIILQTPKLHAQLSSTISTKVRDTTFLNGRDFWFAEQSNDWGIDLGGEYMRIYITSPSTTTAYVESEGTVTAVPVAPNGISSFDVPEFWQLESSGIVESKGIHVYSNDANIAVYNFSHSSYGAGGECILPTLSWGTNYVVAAYGSLFEGYDSTVYDFPSTCVIVASEDNTVITIAPTCDCRMCTGGTESGDANSTVVVYPADGLYEFDLNRGQCIEMMPVKPSNTYWFDLTGTIIQSNKPVGLLAGSSSPDIPSGFGYANHVEDMIPPVSAWGKTYYSTNFVQQPGMTSHDVASYLFISSVPDQWIWRHSCDSEIDTECMIPNQYGIYRDEIAGAQKFFSDEPFLVVEYSNSSTYPDGVVGDTKPAEVHLTPREHYSKTIEFAALQPVGSIDPYTNYANITVNVKDEKTTYIDGTSILGYTKQCIDSNWEIFTVPKISTLGAHIVTGDDSGVTAIVYGVGTDDFYAWSSTAGVSSNLSADTIPPFADTLTPCYRGFVHLTDSGLLPDGVNMQTGITDIVVDTEYNMTYQLDPDFVEGIGVDTSGYGMSVNDRTQSALLEVEAYDLSGNGATITTTYIPDFGIIEPEGLDLGVWDTGTAPNIAYDTLINEGQTTLSTSSLSLSNGNAGFSLYDSIGGPLDLSPLGPGQRRVIQIKFMATNPAAFSDEIIWTSGCMNAVASLTGSGQASGFTVSNQTWGFEPIPASDTGYREFVTITNLTNSPITIDSVWWADTTHFKPVTALPLSVPVQPDSATFTIAYLPDSNSYNDFTQGIWFSPQVLESGVESPRYDTLVGHAVAVWVGVNEAKHPSVMATVTPLNEGHSLELLVPNGLTDPVHFELLNLLGKTVITANIGLETQSLDVSTFPRGVYFWRLNSGSKDQNGKVILGQ